MLKRAHRFIYFLTITLLSACGDGTGVVGTWKLYSVGGSTTVDNITMTLSSTNTIELLCVGFDTNGDPAVDETSYFQGTYQYQVTQGLTGIVTQFTGNTCFFESGPDVVLVEEVTTTQLTVKGLEPASPSMIFNRI